MIQLVTNSKVADSLREGQVIRVRGAMDTISLVVMEIKKNIARLEAGEFTAWLQKEDDGWYYSFRGRKPYKV